jgi:hypothetical protein
VLIEMAARAIARTALGYEVGPLEIKEIVLGRFSAPLMEVAERAGARLPRLLCVS